jgi:hypothetical protein
MRKVELRTLMEIIGMPMVFPDSSDPDAKMLIHNGKIDEAAHELASLIGMLEQTGYTDAPSDYWGGAVTLGTRFLYYHELGHLNHSLFNNFTPDWLLPGEEYLVGELVADQFALTMLTLELRNHPQLQHVGFAGVSLALSFVALKEYAEVEYDGGKRRIKDATFRMHRLLYWGALSVQLGGMTAEAVEQGKFFWELFASILRKVDSIPFPIFSLFLQTVERPREEWRVASNYILRWCVFGDREKVFSVTQKIRESAVNNAAQQSKAQKVLELVEFLIVLDAVE